MRARNRQHFETLWTHHIEGMAGLCESLSLPDATEFLKLMVKAKEYIRKASEHTFNEKGEYKIAQTGGVVR